MGGHRDDATALGKRPLVHRDKPAKGRTKGENASNEVKGASVKNYQKLVIQHGAN